MFILEAWSNGKLYACQGVATNADADKAEKLLRVTMKTIYNLEQFEMRKRLIASENCDDETNPSLY